ncbi:Polyketide synthase PksR [Kordia antarctica]|uniref:Polyketide synthase PksR n=1 Tax=Kordia antarctica TaxID=1218801 RepID=A0A7L4ZK62_9FLAO|nr:class I SAM-dependent methyltransferase [Kordia antarctica]QHI36901.1 Polyketide synthase PksR [Kordia antarctica]
MSIIHTLQEKDEQALLHNTISEGKEILSRYAQLKLLLHLQEHGFFAKKEIRYSLKSIKKDFNFLEKYRALFLEIINILSDNEYILITGDAIVTTKKVETVQSEFNILESEILTGSYSSEDFQKVISPYIKLMNSTSALLLQVASGKLGYLNALFPKGDKTIVEAIYKTNIQVLYNTIVTGYTAQIAKTLQQTNKTVRILEIGAGTGGTTTPMLEMLKAANISTSYMYTDISRGMLRFGKSKFNETYDFIDYKTLNIDQDPLTQGFEANSFDIIICSNVLHATLNINETLARIKELLASSNGYLIVNEVIEKLDFNTITFGLTDGWWKYTDEENRKSYSPVLTQQTWNTLLSDANLTEITPSQKTKEIYQTTSQGVFMYKS